MWPITTEHPRAASEYSPPIATLVEQLVWLVWKGNDVKCVAWLNSAELPAIELKKKLCFLPRVILLLNFALMGARITWTYWDSWVLEAARTETSMGGLIWVQQVKWLLFTLTLIAEEHFDPRQSDAAAHVASTSWCKCNLNGKFLGSSIWELQCPGNWQRLCILHQYHGGLLLSVETRNMLNTQSCCLVHFCSCHHWKWPIVF